jgi:hypothetical protein
LIALDGSAASLGDHEAKTFRLAGFDQSVANQGWGGGLFAGSHNLAKVLASKQPVCSIEHGLGLGRKFFAALATTGGQNGATGAGCHAKPKTVGLGATTVIGLESALAHFYTPKIFAEPKVSRLLAFMG